MIICLVCSTHGLKKENKARNELPRLPPSTSFHKFLPYHTHFCRLPQHVKNFPPPIQLPRCSTLETCMLLPNLPASNRTCDPIHDRRKVKNSNPQNTGQPSVLAPKNNQLSTPPPPKKTAARPPPPPRRRWWVGVRRQIRLFGIVAVQGFVAADGVFSRASPGEISDGRRGRAARAGRVEARRGS